MKKYNSYALIFICFLFIIMIDMLFVINHRVKEKDRLYRLEVMRDSLERQNDSLRVEAAR